VCNKGIVYLRKIEAPIFVCDHGKRDRNAIAIEQKILPTEVVSITATP
jgi:hypothetical protein